VASQVFYLYCLDIFFELFLYIPFMLLLKLFHEYFYELLFEILIEYLFTDFIEFIGHIIIILLLSVAGHPFTSFSTKSCIELLVF
jgi:hypothetical protein